MHFYCHQMSLNPQAEGKSLYDVLDGSVTSYFTRLAGVLQRNESVNGMYQTNVSSCYSGNTPVKVPGFCRVCISSNGANLVDLANSFITLKLKYQLKLTQALSAAGVVANANISHRYLFVGFKNSLEALSRYDIYVNANKIYSQAWVGPESFIFNAGMCQTVREKSPYVYTCSKNVEKMDNNVCGVYIDLTTAGYVAGTAIEVEIPVKINLHQILMLASVRYLPSFCGRWEIELYPNWNNLVVLPVLSKKLSAYQLHQIMTTNAWLDDYQLTHSFVQLGHKFNMIDYVVYGVAAAGGTVLLGTTNAAAAGSIVTVPVTPAAGGAAANVEVIGAAGAAAGYTFTVTGQQAGVLTSVGPGAITRCDNQSVECNEGELTECLMNLTTFQLRFEVFEGLRQMYAEQPLIIPTNILHYSRFSGQPGSGNVDGDDFHATLSQCLENCDSIFILTPNDNSQTTCYYQPYLRNFRIALGEFGTHPQRYVQTFNDPRFLAMALDALNLETSDITAMNEDVARALVSPRKMPGMIAGAGANPYWNKELGDQSNFFIGVSLSQVGFQSGTVSSPNTNIPFIFDATLDRGVDAARHISLKIDTSIICLFLLDCALMIQVVPNSDIPVVKLTNKAIV
jgi:hypothetical protein